jgi:hypothetical protein
MNNNGLIKHIESNFNVKSIKYNSLNLWLELRNRIFVLITLGQESTLKVNSNTYKSIVLSAFYGFFNWFKSYDAWIFSSKINRLLIDDKYHDRLFEYIGNSFEKSLFIEVTTDKHYKRNKVASKYIVSKSILILIEKCLGLFISVKQIDLIEIDKIKEEYQINFNPNYTIKKMITQYRVMKFLLRFKSPKVVFLAPTYTSFGYVKAFKEKGIKVIEVQHGVIVKEHFGYNFHEKFDEHYFPDYLLSFGEQEIEVFKNNYGISSHHIVPVGNYYLDYLNTNLKVDVNLEKTLKCFKKSFVVSLQEIDKTEALIPNIILCAKENTDCIFILKPRKLSVSFYKKEYEKLDNVLFIDDLNIYQLISQTDFHITVYSTCAIEAPALGKHNILFNLNNLSKSIFGSTLTNKMSTTYVENLKELNFVVRNTKVPLKSDILMAHKSVIMSNYKVNIDNFIQNLKL